MKILAIGDFHGKFPAKLKKIARSEDIDLIISTGDYAGIDRWKPYIIKRFKLLKQGKPLPTLEEFFGKKGVRDLWRDDFLAGQKMLTELDKIGKPVIAIFGNGDDEWYKYPFDKDVDLLKKKTVNVLKKLQNFKIITYGTTVFQNIGFWDSEDIWT